MAILEQSIQQTPIWVWFLLAYLIWRGVKARQPAETTLVKLALIPAIFTVWGAMDLIRLYGVGVETLALWLGGIAIGAAIGWLILAGVPITGNAQTLTIHRPADFTLLPLLLITFAVKYCFGVIGAVSPELLQQTGFRIADLGLCGAFTGIFIGKFARYAGCFLQFPKGSRV